LFLFLETLYNETMGNITRDRENSQPDIPNFVNLLGKVFVSYIFFFKFLEYLPGDITQGTPIKAYQKTTNFLRVADKYMTLGCTVEELNLEFGKLFDTKYSEHFFI
jgi:hypothetical protein